MNSALAVLAVAFIAGRLGAEVAERLRQPAVVGEIVAGIIVGPAVLAWVPAHTQAPTAVSVLEAVAGLGIIVLLFKVGLETRLGDLRAVGGRSTAAAVFGMALPFLLGWGLMQLIGRSGPSALFVGTAMVATSIGVTARVLADRGKLATTEARIIMVAALIDDVLALMLLGVVSGVVDGESSVPETVLLVAIAIAFLATILTAGRATLRRAFPFLARLRATDPVLGWAIVIALWLAVSAEFVGLAPIVGAYIAGVLFAEVGGQHELEAKMHPIVVFLTPLFFVYVGTLVEIDQLASAEGVGLALAVTALAVIGKLVGSGAAVLNLGRRSAAIVGVGMVPRGEVGIIVAALGLKLGVVDTQLYGVVVVMSLVTTVVAPPVLAALYSSAEKQFVAPAD